jgi:hypothetical protein
MTKELTDCLYPAQEPEIDLDLILKNIEQKTDQK